MNVAWDARTAHEIGVEWLLAEIAPAGDFGRRERDRERTYAPGDEALATSALARIAALAQTCDPSQLAAAHAAIAGAPDPSGAFVRARGGSVLEDVEFFDVARFIDAVATTAGFMPEPEAAALAPGNAVNALARALALGRGAERSFYLADAYDPKLGAARRRSADARAAYDAERERLRAFVASYAGVAHVRDGEFTLARSDLRGPVPAEIRIVREASTYVLCEIANDAAALDALATLERESDAVAASEDAVRARLSHLVREAAPALDALAVAIGRLDLTLARVRYVQRYGCIVPDVCEDAAIAFEDGRYLPLAAALGARGRSYVPISLDVRGVGIVAGANMGGKTAALRTLGFLTASVALGVPVPAARARVPLVSRIAWLGIGGSIDEASLLSAYGSEVVALRDYLARDRGRALVLIDEFARTTSPREGRALLVALVGELARRGAFGLAATHFAGVARAAGAPHYAIGGHGPLVAAGTALDLPAALERIAARTDYRVFRVAVDAPPSADALELAAALGLDAALIARAREALADDRG